MQIQSVRHKGLKRLIEDDDDRGIRRDLVGRVRNVVTVLIAAADMDGVQGPPGWRIVRFNPVTDEFGVLSSSGTIKTYYKPDPVIHGKVSNLDYFNAQ